MSAPRSRVRLAVLAALVVTLSGCGGYAGQGTSPAATPAAPTGMGAATNTPSTPKPTVVAATPQDGSSYPAGSMPPGAKTTMTQPKKLGLNMKLAAEAVAPSTVQVTLTLRGWVPRLTNGDVYTGIGLEWGDGSIDQDNFHPGAYCPQQGQYVYVNEQRTYSHSYAAPGNYRIRAITEVCLGPSDSLPFAVTTFTATQ